jgi:hypothetical protein
MGGLPSTEGSVLSNSSQPPCRSVVLGAPLRLLRGSLVPNPGFLWEHFSPLLKPLVTLRPRCRRLTTVSATTGWHGLYSTTMRMEYGAIMPNRDATSGNDGGSTIRKQTTECVEVTRGATAGGYANAAFRPCRHPTIFPSVCFSYRP